MTRTGKNVLIVSAVLLAVLIPLGRKVYNSMVRGLRNNNPGNLKSLGIPWQGKIGTDGTFDIFDTMENGIRALTKDLKKDFFTDGQETITALISEFAPGSENNTAAYIARVSEAVGKGPDAVLDWAADSFSLIKGIIRHENGSIAAAQIADETIKRGIASA
jgi:hypothetical protein